ncbi:MAG: hypothetical protein R2795_25210 [Saprospiraceae bacterium]
MENGGVIYIAPEGGSYVERRLRTIKTGTARIALGTEANNDFRLGLHIYPVGLNYEHPTLGGTRLYMEAGTPLRVADWQEAYAIDPVEAVRDLTARITTSLQALMLDTADEAQDHLLYRLESMHQHDAPLPVDAHYRRTRQLLKGLKQLQANDPVGYQQLANEISTYQSWLQTHQLTDAGVSRANGRFFTWWLIPGALVAAYGYIHNLLPFRTPVRLEKILGLHISYRSTTKIVSGLVLVPFFYWLQYRLACIWLPTSTAMGYALSWPITGIISWLFVRHTRPRYEGFKWRQWAAKHQAEAKEIVVLREKLKSFG